MAEETKRELECLTLHAADLLPAEVPWQGLASSAILLETPSRQMVPFSPFDATLGDANMLIMAKSGGGKTFMAQLLLLMLARTGTQISILERGDSYRPLVELMGGRVIDVNLDGNETLNPWDLPQGEKTPSKEKIAFLKNLTRHMIGDAPGSDNTLVDNIISEAIARTYRRVGLRYANPVPTFSDLRDELAQWQDEEKMQRSVDEAKLAAIKLRKWTDKGIYSRLFDRHTNIPHREQLAFLQRQGVEFRRSSGDRDEHVDRERYTYRYRAGGAMSDHPALAEWEAFMRVGTKSVLYGAHCVVVHPWFLAVAWSRLYGFPWDIRLWFAFALHDVGYFFKNDMDGLEGETHVELRAGSSPRSSGKSWGALAVHSQYWAKRNGRQFSRLCVADKLAFVLTPDWLYVPMARVTGELSEYMLRAKERQAGW